MSPDQTAFRLSRVYAQGWNAARQMRRTPTQRKDVDDAPYATDPERTSWQRGFSEGST